MFCAIWYHEAEACNFTKRNTPPWVFFTFFKWYKWYQFAQCITLYTFFRKYLKYVVMKNQTYFAIIRKHTFRLLLKKVIIKVLIKLSVLGSGTTYQSICITWNISEISNIWCTIWPSLVEKFHQFTRNSAKIVV